MLAKIKNSYAKFLCFLTLLYLGTTTAALAGGGGAPRPSNFGAGNAQQQYGAGANLSKVSDNATKSFEMVWIVLCSLATLVGLGFAFSGFMKLKKAQDPSSGVQASSGWMLIAIGACLVVLPWVLFTAANTITTTT